MEIIAYTNQKGGVGKSTSCINMASILGEKGFKVLVIDMDPQANCTFGLGIDLISLESKNTIYECMTKDISILEVIIETPFKNVNLIPSFITLSNAEIEISSKMGRETILNDKIQETNLDFDYILIDLPPTLGILTINGLVAAKEIIVPVDTGIFALSGIQQLLNIISLVKRKFNPSLNIKGVLMTKVDSRTKISKELFDSLKQIFSDKMFDQVIHQNVKIADAQQNQMPINYFDKKSSGYIEYNLITEAILK